MESPALTVRFEGLGRETQNVKSYTIDSAFMTSTDEFSFVLYEPSDFKLARRLELQQVQLLLEGNVQCVGRIEKSRMGDQGYAVACMGRDYMAELIENQIDPSFRLQDGEQLDAAMLRGCSPCGIVAIEFGDESWRNVRSGGLVKTTGAPGERIKQIKAKDFKPNPGQGTYEYFNHLAARHGITLQPVQERTRFAFVAPDYLQEPQWQLVRRHDNPAGNSNNIIDAYAERDFTRFPTYALGIGRQAGTAEAVHVTAAESSIGIGSGKGSSTSAESSKAAVENIGATVTALIPEDVHPITERLAPGKRRPLNALYRMFYLRDEEAKTQDELDRALARACAERMKDALQYHVKLSGHTDPVTGAMYTTNTIVQVTDELSDVDEPLWIEHVRFSYEGQGRVTDLTCWRPGSFGI